MSNDPFARQSEHEATARNVADPEAKAPIPGSGETEDHSPAAEPAPLPNSTPDLRFLAAPQGPDELGRLGTYRIFRVLGEGGMGLVFHAEDRQLGRPVALKVMKPDLAAEPVARQRFLQEARAAAALRHDHIVIIYQVGEDRGVPFLAMELLPGESLEARLKHLCRLPLTDTLRIGREIAEGLAVAHHHGIIHRDIKPANVWLDAGAGGRVKILDFGLARPGVPAGGQHLTHSGVILGTPAYMAPEQARARPVDGRADLFSLGVVLYRLCTGDLPFRGKDSVGTLLALVTQEPRPPHVLQPATPRALSDLIVKLLAKDPADRFPSAQTVVEKLAALETECGHGTPSAVTQTVSAPSRRLQSRLAGATRKRWLAGAAAGCIGLLFVALLVLNPFGRPSPGRPGPQSPESTKPPAPRPEHALSFASGGHVELPALACRSDSRFTVEAYAVLLAEPSQQVGILKVGNLLHARGHMTLRITQVEKRDLLWELALFRPGAAFSVSTYDPVAGRSFRAELNRRMHVAGVCDGDTLRVFLDGQRVAYTAPDGFGAAVQNRGAVRLGEDFPGLVREVRISRSARYRDAFALPRRLEADTETVALYRCDEGEGNSLFDLSGKGNHGRIVGAKWVKADGAAVPEPGGHPGQGPQRAQQ
jgi:serine/threonine protein kinase